MDRPAKSRIILYVLACLLLLPSLPASADQALDDAIAEASKYSAFVFLVNGFTGCCIPGKKFRKFLQEKGAYVDVEPATHSDVLGRCRQVLVEYHFAHAARAALLGSGAPVRRDPAHAVAYRELERDRSEGRSRRSFEGWNLESHSFSTR